MKNAVASLFTLLLTLLLSLLLASLLVLFPLVTSAAEPEALLQLADRARGGDLPGIAWIIEINSHDSDGDTRQVMNAIAVTHDNISNTRVDYTSPEKIKGQRVLMVGRNMWFSRPGLQKPVPISPRQRLIGQAANGDIAATHYTADYNAKAVGTEQIGNESCVLFELTAKEKNVTYDRIRYWVSEKRKVGVKAEFYTVSGKLFKSATFEYGNDITYEGQHIPFVSRMVITDALNTSNVTTLDYREVRVKKPDPSLFELNS
ncbi:MAG TPA: outer membrane lipoprotein-sorting protein [Rhodocyclaceae bacterium]|nr:outer membrane lipoprotein-sorting protein [Rhodocyclaceae bacterium]